MDIGHQETEQVLRRTERELKRIYLQAQTEAQQKLEDHFRKYEIKDRIKREALRKGEITEAEYAYWRKGQICIGQRWSEMVDTLTRDYVNADKIAMSTIYGHMPEAYAINHNYATFQVEQGSHVDTSYTLYDRSTVERLVRDNPELLPKPRVDIPKDKRWNRAHIRDAITQGIVQGEDLRKVAHRLQKVTDMDYRAALRNARTSVTGAQNAGRVEAYHRAEKMGIELEQEWLATLDGRTRHSHRQMDGKRVKIGEKFDNGCMYPGDPSGPPEEVYNCRCTLVPVVKGIDQSDAPRNDKLGGMSYEEWKNESKQKFEPTEAITDDIRFVGSITNSRGDVVRILSEDSQYSYNPLSPRPLTDELELEQKAIAERLRDNGITVYEDNTVTLYNVCSLEHAEYIRKHGFVGTTSPVGGNVSEDIGLRSFFGLDKAWDAEWSSGGYVMFEIKVPTQYIRQAAQNQYEVYIEGTVTRRSNGVWEPDVIPTSTFYDRMAIKKYKRRHGL